ncbi:unnamed protein product [marine sediment metagenome]|uniref:Uncharacterized protein n=1 Tax=marine sediment metagenome TaxID=412755 RepID=X0V2I8_9ZZZZ
MKNAMRTFRFAHRRGDKFSRLFLMILSSLFIINTALPSIASAANSLSQFGITWTFDKELSTDGAGNTYQYGQFANGDYWVVGSVTIVGIDPLSNEVEGRTMHGSMVNPSPEDGQIQGYDSAVATTGNIYDANYNVALDVDAENPLVLSAHSSLV